MSNIDATSIHHVGNGAHEDIVNKNDLLNYRHVGNGRESIVFLHGLFGQGKNFTSIASSLADIATCYLIDLPNHGRSLWTDRFDYSLFAYHVVSTIQSITDQPITLVGHSMGGKVAMRVALDYPDILSRLTVIDIAPTPRLDTSEFAHIITTLRGVDLISKSRGDIDRLLARDFPSDQLRGFLLQNLVYDSYSSRWTWQINLDLLVNSLEQLADWPSTDARWEGQTLWIVGDQSPLDPLKDKDAMRALFPHVRTMTVKDAKHWVHADAPQVVSDAIRYMVRV